jgi:hypothetical protein
VTSGCRCDNTEINPRREARREGTDWTETAHDKVHWGAGLCEDNYEPPALIKALPFTVSINFPFTQQRIESQFSDMLAELKSCLSEELHATVPYGSPPPAAKAVVTDLSTRASYQATP